MKQIRQKMSHTAISRTTSLQDFTTRPSKASEYFTNLKHAFDDWMAWMVQEEHQQKLLHTWASPQFISIPGEFQDFTKVKKKTLNIRADVPIQSTDLFWFVVCLLQGASITIIWRCVWSHLIAKAVGEACSTRIPRLTANRRSEVYKPLTIWFQGSSR